LPTEKELYTIKKLKTFKGMEGMGGFNLDLCRKGKKIAECINDDTGGDTMFYRRCRKTPSFWAGI